MNPYNFALLVFSFCSFFVGLLVLLKRNDEIGKLFFIFSMFVTGWSAANSWMYSNDYGYAVSLQSTRIAHFCSIFIIPSWLHFVFAVLGIVKKKARILKIVYGFSFFLVCFVGSSLFIPKVKPIVGFQYFTHYGPLYILYAIEFAMIISYGFYQLVHYWRLRRGERKRQLGFFIFTAAVGFVSGSLAFIPVFDIPLPQYNIFFTPLYPFLMAYVMIRQKFFDVEEVLAIHRDKLALIGLLSSSINHEIKNPLFILQELAKKTKNELSNDSQRNNENLSRLVSRMTDQITRMKTLVERLGEFGKTNVDAKGNVDIKQAIENALYFASQELRDHRVAVELKIADNLAALRGGKSQFEEIFLNLFMNAYHAMPNGGTLTVIASSVGAKQSLEITISDTGTGIPKEELKNIFKPFYTTKQKTGTGLGLHIVKTLVEQNGGKISVESEVGTGTEFRIQFKL